MVKGERPNSEVMLSIDQFIAVIATIPGEKLIKAE
jgi:hypothetical protein